MEVKHKEKRFMVHAGFISKIVNWSLTDTLIWLAWNFKFLKYVAAFFLIVNYHIKFLCLDSL